MKNFLKWFIIAILIISQLPLTQVAAEETDTHLITYLKDGNLFHQESVYNGANITYVPDQIVGYQFDGWYTDSDLENAFDDTQPITQPYDLFGKWVPEEYEIKFYLNEGDQEPYLTQPIKYEEKITKPDNPVKTGYTFNVWKAQAGSAYDFDAFVTESVNLYADWTINEYEVTFDGLGESYNTSIQYEGTVTQPNDPPKFGHNFVGWFISLTGNEEYNFATPVTEPITIYPRWEKAWYVVQFIVEGEVIDGLEYEFDSKIESDFTVEKHGYSVKEWYKDSEYKYSWDFENDTVQPNTKLYGKWDRGKFKVTFNNGTSITSQTVEYEGKLRKPINPVRTGYDFVGWSETPDSENPVWNFTTDVVRNTMTLYPKWEPIPQTVNIIGFNGVSEDYEVNYDSTITHFPDTEVEGFTFKGWFVNGILTNQWDVNSGMVLGPLTLHGVWERNIYDVTLMDGESTHANLEILFEDTLQGEIPLKEGYDLIGVYLEATFENEWDINTDKITNDKTLYSKWEIKSYSVTFNDDGTLRGPTSYNHFDKIEKPADPEKTGYKFIGWFTETNKKWDFENDQVTSTLKLTTKFEILKYDVIFMDGEEEYDKYINVEHFKTITPPEDDLDEGEEAPKKNGHTFVGWGYKTAEEAELEAWNFTEGTIIGPLTLYAMYSINEYTVQFYDGLNPDTASEYEEEKLEKNYNSTIGTSPAVAKEGYELVAWLTEDGEEWDIEDDLVVGNLKLYAKWEINEYNVVFMNENLQYGETVVMEHFKKVSEPEEDPEKVGHTFVRWVYEVEGQEGRVAYDFNQQVEGPLTLYAEYSVNKHTVKFINEFSPDIVNRQVDYGNKVGAPPTVTKEGYNLLGWATASEDLWDFENTITGDLTLYASWEIKKYDVTFMDGEDEYELYEDVEHFATIDAPEDEPTKTGHTFEGWYYKVSGQEELEEYDFSQTIVGPLTLYAQFTPISYEITFENQNGEEATTVNYNYGTNIEEPEAPSKVGHIFSGWATYDEDLEEYVPWDFAQTVTGNLTLYALWEKEEYTVTFNNEGDITTAKVKYEENAVAPTLSKEHYTFEGWFTEPEFTNEWDFDSDLVTEAITLFAKWEIKKYNVTVYSFGEEIEELSITYNELITGLPSLNEEGYVFDGWYSDSDFENEWNVATGKIQGDMTLYAKWIVIPDAPTNVKVAQGNLQVTVSFDGSKGADSYKVIVLKNGDEDATLSNEGQASPIEINNLSYGIAYTFQVIALNEEVASERSAVSDSITFTAPVTPPSGGGGAPSTPSTPTEEEIKLPIINGGSEQTLEAMVNRIRNGQATTDEIALTNALIQQALASLQAGNNNSPVIGLSIGNQPAGTLTQFKVEALAAKALADYLASLQLGTDAGAVIIPSVSLQSDGDITFEFNAAVLQQNIETIIQEILAQTTGGTEVNSSAINVIGTPVSIKTNLQNTPVTVRLPIPASLSEEERKKIMVYIDHSNGERELKKGRIVQLTSGAFVFEVDVNHFSTFALVTVDGLANEMKPGYIKGYANGGFGPNDVVTRGELATMLARFVTEGAIPRANTTYTDTANHFAKDAIELVREAGLFKGVTEVLFKPADQMTRAEVAAVAMRWIQLQCENDEEYKYCVAAEVITPYTDVDSNHWAYTAIQAISARGIMVGKGADNFDPNGIITRAEAVKVLNRLFGYEPMQNVTASSFNDVAPTHWAIGEIEAAAKGFTGK